MRVIFTEMHRRVSTSYWFEALPIAEFRGRHVYRFCNRPAVANFHVAQQSRKTWQNSRDRCAFYDQRDLQDRGNNNVARTNGGPRIFRDGILKINFNMFEFSKWEVLPRRYVKKPGIYLFCSFYICFVVNF